MPLHASRCAHVNILCPPDPGADIARLRLTKTRQVVPSGSDLPARLRTGFQVSEHGLDTALNRLAVRYAPVT